MNKLFFLNESNLNNQICLANRYLINSLTLWHMKYLILISTVYALFMDALLILAPMPLEKGTIIGSSVSVLGLCTLQGCRNHAPLLPGFDRLAINPISARRERGLIMPSSLLILPLYFQTFLWPCTSWFSRGRPELAILGPELEDQEAAVSIGRSRWTPSHF